MRYFDELQNKLISYWDALAEGSSTEIDVEGLEADLLAHRPGGYLDIYQGITDFIQAARHIRSHSSDYDYFDFLTLEEDVQALYYLMSIADQGSGSSVVEVPAAQTPRPGKTSAPPKTEESHKTEPEKVTPREEIKIAAMSKGARYIFENNPYCVLGISCSSTRSEALKVRDKLQKLSHLNAAHTYTTEFDLSFVEKPNRELGRIQVILENVTDMSHRWLWFKEASYYSKAWDALNIYREENSAFSYDRLVVSYLALLLTDAEMSNSYSWKILFTAIKNIYSLTNKEVYDIVKERLPESELDKYNYHMIATSFRDSILVPVIMNIENADGIALKNIMSVIEQIDETFRPMLRNAAVERAFAWANSKIEPLSAITETLGKKSYRTKQEVQSLETTIDAYFDTDFELVQHFATVLAGVDLYTERINERIRSVVWDATNLLSQGGKKQKACKYDCLIYPFCSESQQKEIKKFYPYEMQTLPDSAYSIEECKEASNKFGQSGDLKNKFIWLLKAAEKGDAGSQNDIGVAYALGQGVPADARKAVEWYEKAAAQGNAFGLSNMANRYYNGTYPCSKNQAKAKDYWIRAVAALRREDDIKSLNEKFPGWQRENHPSLNFGESDWEYKLRPMAELGVPSAEYWYGYHLLLGKNGCKKDVDAARRWILLASAHKYSRADITLEVWFEIDAKEATTSSEMLTCGNKYDKLDGTQNKDVAFYWYYRSYHEGNKSAANNLGVCYHDGKGTQTNYQKANELYQVGISQNNSASYYNYGWNLYYGQGVAKDINKARTHMQKSAQLGFASAKDFLKEHFNITQVTYKSFEQLWFNHQDGISMSFYKLEVVPEGIKLTFWGSNRNNSARAFWLEYYTIDGDRQSNWSKLVELNGGQSDFFSFIIEGKQSANRITLSIEIDQNSTNKVFSYPELVILLDNNTGTITPYISSVTPASSSHDEDEDDEDELDEFEDIEFALYDKNNLHIEFCNFEVDDDDVYMCFWANNKSNRTYKLWIMNVNVDGEQVANVKSLVTIPAGETDYGKLKLPDVSPDTYYTIDAYIEVDDENNKELDRTPRFSIEVDFNDFTQNAELLDEEDEDEDEDIPDEFEDIEFEVYDNDDVNVEFCRCIVEDDVVKFSFYIRNNSDRTIHVWAKDVCVDGEKVESFKEIGEVEAGDSDFGEFQLDEVSPESYYNITACIEIDDEDDDCIDTGDTFSIDVDFDDMTLSAEME